MSEQLRVGQIWADNDRREKKRTVKIIQVSRTHVLVQNIRTNRFTSIRIDRVRPTSTGYRCYKMCSPSTPDAQQEAERIVQAWKEQWFHPAYLNQPDSHLIGLENLTQCIHDALTRARQEGEAAGGQRGRREVWEEAARAIAGRDDVAADEFRRRAAQEGTDG